MNDWYVPSGSPSTNSQGSSSVVRGEFNLLKAAFDKLAGLTGNSLKILRVNSGESGFEAVTPTGTGLPVAQTSPTLVTPVLGVATATTINKVALTQPATGSTLTIADGKTLTASNTITLSAGSDGLSFNLSALAPIASPTFTGTVTMGAGTPLIIGTSSGASAGALFNNVAWGLGYVAKTTGSSGFHGWFDNTVAELMRLSASTLRVASGIQFEGPNGTQLLPTYSFTSDPTSGMYLDAGSNLSLGVGGSPLLIVNTGSFSGTVGGKSFQWDGTTFLVNGAFNAQNSGFGVIKVEGTQVVATRVTGYAAMTGTPNKNTAYATSTVTLAQLAGRVMQLQADLTTHGLIGA